jgi:hypothetical protein
MTLAVAVVPIVNESRRKRRETTMAQIIENAHPNGEATRMDSTPWPAPR